MLKAINAATALMLAIHPGPPALAAFVLLTARPTSPAVSQPSAPPSPIAEPAIAATPLSRVPLNERSGAPIKVVPPNPVVRGFGNRVPLSFAVRQIVPVSLHVMYANGEDPSELVIWSGGQAWNVVLERTVRPLGLRVRISPSTVTLYR
jgi:hypothetical protein